ncbi:hypothetical protein ONE63_006425 [Megalurothrips usitatus]|uniref:Partial AB-hydrolase lipase domain-containing protein n=1 Tax=Megalurothrips usitatus TaxID=439358 RepID=A0AAV7Y089_9NEOP|nr:hypothetical protein ONE63_006425 [Megalurothrips usitatus]
MMESEVSWVPVLLPALLLLLCQLSCAARPSPSTIVVPGPAPAAAARDSVAAAASDAGPPPTTTPATSASSEPPANTSHAHTPAHTPPTVLEDASLSVPKLVRKYGYPLETHVVMTDDGYVLTLHRMPHGRTDSDSDDINSNRVRSLRKSLRRAARSRTAFTSTGIKRKRGIGRQGGRAVLLLPGMFCSSAVWIIMGPKKGLAYLLADAGYDVWIANPRGNRYSMGHVEIPSSDEKYWQFSWHEMGEFDVPAVLDYVTAITDQERVPVVGHSMGNTMMMVMGSLRPEYNRLVAVHVALAPTVYLQHAQSPILKGLAALAPTVSTLSAMLGVHGLRPTLPLNEALKQLCREEAVVTQRICKNAAFMLLGFDPEQLNATTLPVVMGHIPSGGSTRTLLHYAQSFTSGDFRQYDLGVKRNLVRYGQPTPPAYNLSRVDFPVAIAVGENDWLDSMEDVQRIVKVLPNIVDFYRVPWPKFNHMDHLFAIDVKELEYDHVMEVLERFS